jgi:hypothetical protein
VRHFEQSIDLHASVNAVYAHLDDFERLGAHMMHSSWMMAGSAMRYEFDAARGRKLGAKVRIVGAFLGIKLVIDEEISRYEPPLHKAWNTVGKPKMIIMRGYSLGFDLAATAGGCRLKVFIDYELPEHGSARWLGKMFGAPYARWCVTSMIADASKAFGNPHVPHTMARGTPS